MNSTVEQLLKINKQLQELIPQGDVHTSMDRESGYIQVNIFRIRDYKTATEILRNLGIDKRSKRAYTSYTCLSGNTDGIHFNVYCDELPPTCHLEKVTKRIPKTDVVETKDFIEIEEMQVVCSGAHKEVDDDTLPDDKV